MGERANDESFVGAESLEVASSDAASEGGLPSLGDILAEHGPRILKGAVAHPELVVAAGLALVFHKRVPAVRDFFARLLGKVGR